MSQQLSGKKIAIVVENGFEQVEMTQPRQAFQEAGAQTFLISPQEADAVKGRTVTSWSSLQTDLRNAGANWVDREVVVDNGLVTSRNPNDIPAFNEKAIELFAAGQREPQLL